MHWYFTLGAWAGIPISYFLIADISQGLLVTTGIAVGATCVSLFVSVVDQ